MSSKRGIGGLKSPYFIELFDLKDLARLTCAFEKTPLPVFSFEFSKETHLATHVDTFINRPIFYYAKTKEVKHFLCYKNSSGVEEAVLSNSPSTPIFMYAPIISLKELPKLFRKGLEHVEDFKDRIISVQVKDITSLAKISSYNILSGEPPLPLFLFKSGEENILGTFTRLDESNENSIFFYAALEDMPAYNFIKYSAIKIGELNFTNKVDEPSKVYIKIIKLVGRHPLVELEK
ncbi:MAG: hypothetical protein L6N95_01400 [Candidatus Methylarchaceae archaeon HK01B]|nr:hypothetical protein [Candidatus Methylarchaceae archaeon HK01M]MCP8312584.1 hypothetical protein [Candidatus Methylarchaceae archaeon HK02M1]MCP8318468.1 hypothetical protein [Candidatus Methylarchaceae archaeon HK01B]